MKDSGYRRLNFSIQDVVFYFPPSEGWKLRKMGDNGKWKLREGLLLWGVRV